MKRLSRHIRCPNCLRRIPICNVCPHCGESLVLVKTSTP